MGGKHFFINSLLFLGSSLSSRIAKSLEQSQVLPIGNDILNITQ